MVSSKFDVHVTRPGGYVVNGVSSSGFFGGEMETVEVEALKGM